MEAHLIPCQGLAPLLELLISYASKPKKDFSFSDFLQAKRSKNGYSIHPIDQNISAKSDLRWQQ